MAARWDKGGKDYINCPLDKEQYEAFVQALRDGEKTEFKEWEKDTPYFEGCMPIEVMAERGVETLALRPDEGRRPRQSAHRTLALRRRPAPPGQCARHLVEHGRLPDQAEARRAGPHLPHHSRASRMPSSRGSAASTATASSTRPRLLDGELRLKSKPNIRFAGQITGCEGYVESAAIGLIAARFAAAELQGEDLPSPPPETALGALLGHITGGADAESFQPMNVNFGLMPPDPRPLEEGRPEEDVHRPRPREARRVAGAGARRGTGLVRKLDRRDQLGHSEQPRLDRLRHCVGKPVRNRIPRLEVARRSPAPAPSTSQGSCARPTLSLVADLETRVPRILAQPLDQVVDRAPRNPR